MKKGETTKACPGCKQEGLRDADSVCYHCRLKLQEAEKIREYQARQQNQQVYRIPVNFPLYVVSVSSLNSDNVWKHLRALTDILARLVRSPGIGVPAVGEALYAQEHRLFHDPKRNRTDDSSHDDRKVIQTETAQLIGELDTLLQQSLEAAYQAGKQDGSSLLLQLASGELSVADFNKQANHS